MTEEQNKNPISDLPKCIKDLLIETPSAIAKLCALWDGLTAETQTKILSEIKAGSYSCYFTNKIYVKAVKSNNPYVRYLAAKGLSFGEYSSDEVNAVEKLIKEDPEPLVKYCFYEKNWWGGDKNDPIKDCKAFFNLPHDARLAAVRSLKGRGEDIAAIMRYAMDNLLENNEVTEWELSDILADYLDRPEFKSHYESDHYSYDGFGEYFKGKGLGALWGLVPKVPPSCSYVLIKYLPHSGGLSDDIPEKLVDKLDDFHLEHLFDRKDIGLVDLRKKIFWEYIDTYNAEAEEDYSKSGLLRAAISHNFSISYEEFANILSKPEKQRMLRDLTGANDLELCIYQAMHDVMFNCNDDSLSWENAEWATYPFERRLKKLKNYPLKKELLRLKLYSLAKQVVPWKDASYDLPKELDFLQEHIIEGDTWKTFMAFSDNWPKNSFDNLEKQLPKLYEIDEDESEDSENEIIQLDNKEKELTIELSILKTEVKGIKSLIFTVIVLIIITWIFK